MPFDVAAVEQKHKSTAHRVVEYLGEIEVLVEIHIGTVRIV